MKLTKKDLADHAEWVRDLEAARKEIENAVEEYNHKLNKLNEQLESELEKYNGILEDAESWKQGIADTFQAEIDERSEKWLESDAGEAAQDFVNAWNDFSILQETVELPEEYELENDESFIREFDELPIEPENV